ncbi:MAG: sigma-70 family RNA polymerase sigma factor [Thermoleophilia bacterium]
MLDPEAISHKPHEDLLKRIDDQRRTSRMHADRLREDPPAETEISRDLVAAAQAGDPQAREQLIERMLPLVIKAARAYRTPGLDLEDFLQEGIVGVLRALARYDASSETPFPAYATWWIRYSQQELRSDFIRPFRLPPKALRRLAALKEAHERIYARELRDAGPDELARHTGLPVDETEALLRADARVRSLEDPLPGDEGEIGTLGDLLEDPLSEEAYERILLETQADRLLSLLTHLTDREKEILTARYGLDGGDPQTLREVGDRLGISAERVRQIENRALMKLRRSL